MKQEAASTPSAYTLSAYTLSGDESLEFPEFDTPPEDPMPLLRDWIAGAERRGVREPLAAALATAGADGRVSSRIVLLKEVNEAELVFTSADSGRKGRDLAENPHAAVTLYWRETMQQLKAAGRVRRASVEESDLFFAERPRPAQVASIVSHSSELLIDEGSLASEADRMLADDTPLERPADWWGYAIEPDEIEFWQGRSNRLHRRLEFTRQASGWTSRRLQP